MEQIGRVAIFEEGDGFPEENACLADKIVIVLMVWPCPELAWAGDKRMIAWAREKNEKLLKMGLANHELFAQFTSHHASLKIAVEFPDISSAERVFKEAAREGIVDIYLYVYGKLHCKYD